MAHKLPMLPYREEALQPYISAETLKFHHDKHHGAYVQKLNELLTGTGLENMPLEELLVEGFRKAPEEKRGLIYNNGAQAWNHTFLWNCMTPESKKEPKGALAQAINNAYGDFKSFKKKFTATAATLFGSGYTWLVKKGDGTLDVIPTKDGDNPMTQGLVPIFTCDVWEHAYYLDYRNERSQYIEAFWEVVNWDFGARNFD